MVPRPGDGLPAAAWARFVQNSPYLLSAADAPNNGIGSKASLVLCRSDQTGPEKTCRSHAPDRARMWGTCAAYRLPALSVCLTPKQDRLASLAHALERSSAVDIATAPVSWPGWIFTQRTGSAGYASRICHHLGPGFNALL